ncbi:YchJ family protein [Blastococcus sp. Marseille-P5729]|uniref:YchJ family protein n=1 Tax=Blastococcus sp. Marseille-P5729 TaxID=2086582 RepID=UPI000D0E3BEB|nr:YchJ family metal-binding protein [Blastococcus sp. Marseille-P5729]
MSACPCGGESYEACCEPLHDGARDAETASELMRSRYSAYAIGNLNYVFRTWDPATRPPTIEPAGLEWTGLRVVDVVGGSPHDDTGIVEFVASFRDGARDGELHERSRFRSRRARWVYVDAER